MVMIRPWNEIRANYADFANAGSSFQAMYQLVSEIEASDYKHGLFGWTSVHDLCLVQTPVSYPYNGPYLRISPLADGLLEFRYIDTEIRDKQWHRVVAGADGFARLERFFEQLHWF
jgi:hypothetical protein